MSSGGGGHLARRLPARALSAAAVCSLLAVSVAGCHRSHVPGTLSTDVVLTAFQDARLDVDGVKNADAENWGADVCSAGPIAGLDVVICEYANDEKLSKAEADLVRDWNAVKVDTAVVSRNGRTLLMITDHGKQDPNGRTIARMLVAFKPAAP
jgi:hypothetical protein